MVILKTYNFLIILLHFNNLSSYDFLNIYCIYASFTNFMFSDSVIVCIQLWRKYYTKKISKCYESLLFFW